MYFFLILIILGLCGLTFWLFILMDCINAEFKGNEKLLWVLTISFLPAVGCLLYFFIGKQQKIASDSPWDFSFNKQEIK